MVTAIHTAVEGRVRFKINALYRSEQLKQRIEQGLKQHTWIVAVSANTLTGTVLVLFNGSNGYDPPAIAALLDKMIGAEYGRSSGSRGPFSLREMARPKRVYYVGADDTRAGEAEAGSGRPAARKMPRRRRLRLQVARSEELPEAAWHCIAGQEVLTRWETSAATGLSEESVQKRFKQYGPNILPESVPRSGWSIFLDQFKSLPVALLGAAAGISMLTGGLADAVVILGVVVINASIGYATESRTEQTIQGLKSLVRPSSLVLREGVRENVGAAELVPGDVLVLRPGTYIAADARLIDANRLTADESALTGESMPVMKTTEALQAADVPLGDRTNMVYMGTLVTGGQGLAVVVSTGRFTEMGRIQTLVGEARSPETPMERQMRTMGTQLVLISGAVCGIVFVIGMLRGAGFLEMLKISIALAVSAVPEGLPTVATTTLALGIRRMRELQVLIRRLDAVETLGSVQTICMDKTGTVTMNRMSVVRAYTGLRRIELADGAVINANAKNGDAYADPEFLRLVHLSVLCNESAVSGREGEYTVKGTPTENAMVHLALCVGVDVNLLRERHPLIKLNHRTEGRHFMSTVHLAGDKQLLALKGSPADVLSLCRWYLKDGERHVLDDEVRRALEAENQRMAGEALRVLGVAYALVEDSIESEDDVHEGLVWAGLIGMSDIIRSGVKALIATFHNAGIDTVMITGDQRATAYAIGKELDLAPGEELQVLDSKNLAELEPGVVKALAGKIHVFARVSPADKLQIVRALQAAGKIVAMTGDGINDGPALKAADIGIAMGHTGTDVAREVADVVLKDDNLETMVVAISQGRTVYNNIRKSVRFLLSTNMTEITVMFTATAAGIGQPLSVTQLLWINLISDIFPGLALALELPEPDVLVRPPRDPKEPIIKPGDFKRMLFESGAISAGALAAYGYGAAWGQGRAGTMAFMSLCTGQLLHSISCRSETHSIFDPGRLAPNNYLTAALAGSLGLQAMTVFVPGLRAFLGLSPLGLVDLAVAAGSAVAPLIVNEATKKARAREQASRDDKQAAEPSGGEERKFYSAGSGTLISADYGEKDAVGQ